MLRDALRFAVCLLLRCYLFAVCLLLLAMIKSDRKLYRGAQRVPDVFGGVFFLNICGTR